MGKEAWNTIKQNKGFNVAVYRKVSSMLVVSLGMNIVLAATIYFYFTHWPPREYFASDGVSQPVKLTPLDRANETSQALLPPEPPALPEPEVNLS